MSLFFPSKEHRLFSEKKELLMIIVSLIAGKTISISKIQLVVYYQCCVLIG